MTKVDATVRRETMYIACFVLAASLLMEAVFLIIGYWDYRVLLGNIYGGTAAVLNFFLMGLTVQKALGKEEKEAEKTVKLSQQVRLMAMLLVLVVGFSIEGFNTIAVIVPQFFPRIAVAMRPLFDKKMNGGGEE